MKFNLHTPAWTQLCDTRSWKHCRSTLIPCRRTQVCEKSTTPFPEGVHVHRVAPAAIVQHSILYNTTKKSENYSIGAPKLRGNASKERRWELLLKMTPVLIFPPQFHCTLKGGKITQARSPREGCNTEGLNVGRQPTQSKHLRKSFWTASNATQDCTTHQFSLLSWGKKQPSVCNPFQHKLLTSVCQ